MAKFAPKLEDFRICVLVKTYLAMVIGGDHFPDAPYISSNELSETYSNSVGTGYIELALEQLSYDDLVEESSRGNRRVWKITDSGVELIQTDEEDPKSGVSAYLHEGDEWLFRGVKSYSNTSVIKKQNDNDPWEPLEIDREDPAVHELVEKLNQLADLTEADNGYAASEPNERNYVVKGLRVAIDALQEQSVIYRMQVQVYIWEPVCALAERFKKHAIGISSTAVKEALKELFKNEIKRWFLS